MFNQKINSFIKFMGQVIDMNVKDLRIEEKEKGKNDENKEWEKLCANFA